MGNEYLIIPLVGVVAMLVFAYFDIFKDRKIKKSNLHREVSELLDDYDEAILAAHESLTDSSSDKNSTRKKKRQAESQVREVKMRVKKAGGALPSNYPISLSPVKFYATEHDAFVKQKASNALSKQEILAIRREQIKSFYKKDEYQGKAISDMAEGHYRVIKAP